MSDQEGAPKSLTEVIGNRIGEGSKNTKSLFASACIYRVPEDLRKLKESAYTPRLIAIGPLHRYDEHLPKTMGDVKMYYANYLLFRVAEGIEDQGKRDETKIKTEKTMLLQQCVKKMEELVDRAKKWYAEEVEVKDDGEMTEMMLVDGCFILELLYLDKKNKEAGKSTPKGGDSSNSKASNNSAPQPVSEAEDGSSDGSEQQMLDPIFDHILTANIVKHDLLLFENQIPFFVLEELFKLTVDNIPADKIPGGKKLSLTEYVLSYFRNIISPECENNGSEMKNSSCLPCDCAIWVCGSTNECEQGKKEPRDDNHEYDHILHLLHDYYVPAPGDQGANSTGGCSPWHCTTGCETKPMKFSELEIRAKDLDYAGVKFVPVGIEGNNLFDVKFEERKCLPWWLRRARFEIPTLHIHDPTELFLRNLIAFEQCRPRITMIFTSYAKFMDMLINGEEDVRVLRKAKVIRNHLGEDKDVSELFNNLCKEVVIGEFYFKFSMPSAKMPTSIVNIGGRSLWHT